jgi:ubiquinone/menaquinone biosynthesis C-methylase UbiE
MMTYKGSSRDVDLDPAIADYYARASEATRTESGPSQLEFARTMELIQRFAPPSPAVLLDVGGGPGVYALSLSARGYQVHLIDPVETQVVEAQRKSAASAHPLGSCRVGDARVLDWESGSTDIVLLLGPLYHLTDAADRRQALAEAFRVLRQGGILFAAGISKFASAMDGLVRDLFLDPDFTAIVESDVASGQHRNPTERLDFFTSAYFHHPDELRGELDAAGFAVKGVFGLEGPGWLLQDFEKRWADPRTRADLLRIARSLEAEPSLLGVSAHLLGVGWKDGKDGKDGKVGKVGSRAEGADR